MLIINEILIAGMFYSIVTSMLYYYSFVDFFGTTEGMEGSYIRHNDRLSLCVSCFSGYVYFSTMIYILNCYNLFFTYRG
jgi:hypothetical protein